MMWREGEVGPGRDFIDISESVHVHAPIDRVFETWSDYGNFPRFIPHTLEVTRIGENRLRWKTCGPAGSTIEWDAVVTAFVPNRAISWRSQQGAELQSTGNVYFHENLDGSTRVDIRLTCLPEGKGLAHAAALHLSTDLDRSLEEHLRHMKEYIERKTSD